MPTKFVTNPHPRVARTKKTPMRRNYSTGVTTNYLRDLRPAQVAKMVREGALAITHADIGNDYHTVTLFEDGAGENRKQVEAKWFVPGDEWYALSLGLRDGKVDPATADLFLGPSRWDKREREEQTRAAAKRKGIDIDASRHYFNNPRRPAVKSNPSPFGEDYVEKVYGDWGAYSDVRAKELVSLAKAFGATAKASTVRGGGKKVVVRFSKHSWWASTEAFKPFAEAFAVWDARRAQANTAWHNDGPHPDTLDLVSDLLPTARRRNPRAPSMTASVEQDRLSGGWSVYVHDGRRNMDMTGDAFSTEAAAKREAKALLAQARAGVPLETLASMFWEKHYKPFGGHELDNPRRRNPAAKRNPRGHWGAPGIGFRRGEPIPGPSVKMMSDRLRIAKTEAESLKDMMNAGEPDILHAADHFMSGNGVERIPGRPGLMYVNMGDTYDTTLIYDYKTNRFVVSSWGDIVERQPRRFGD